MDDWSNEWMDDWLNDWMDGWMNGWLNEWMIDWMIDWMNDWMNDWMIEWMNGWMNEWRNRGVKISERVNVGRGVQKFQKYQKNFRINLPAQHNNHNTRLIEYTGKIRYNTV